MEDRIKHKLIHKLKEVGAVRNEKVKLKHAGTSNFYIDIKKAYGYPDILDLLCQCIDKKIDNSVTCIAAEGYGGIPLAAVISKKRGLKLTLIREKVKKHGRDAWIDGYVPDKLDKIIIIDDVLTTGESIARLYRILKKTGASLIGSIVVAKRGEPSVDLPCIYILTQEELMK